MIARKSGLIIITNLFAALISYVGLFFIARYMGPEPLGIIGFGIGFIGLFSFLSNLGLDSAHIKRVSEGKELSTCIGTYISLKVLLTFSMVSIVLLALYFWKTFLGKEFGRYEEPVIFLLLVNHFIMSLSQIPIATFTALKKTTLQQLPPVLGAVFKTAAVVLVVFAGYNVIGLAVAYIIGAIVTFIMSVYFFRNYQISMPNRDYLHSYFTFALPLMIMTSIILISLNIDKVMIHTFVGVREIGFYYSIQQIIQAPHIISAAVMVVLFPTISELHSKGDYGSIRSFTLLAERYLSMIMFPFTIFLIVFAKPIVILLFGINFSAAAPILQVLALIPLIAAINRPYSAQIQGMNRPGLEARVGIISVALNVSLNLLLIPDELFGMKTGGLGAVGAAIATVAAWSVGLVTGRIFAYKLTKTKLNFALFKHLFSSVIAIGALVLLYPQSSSPFYLFSAGILFILMYALVLRLIGELTDADIEMVINTINPKK